MARSFSEHEKETIRKKLMDACKQSWTQYGYKKTSVDELCRLVGISKGAFYIYEAASQIMDEHRDRNGAAKAIKMVYREYANNHFLYDSTSTDFTILTNKLSPEQQEKISLSSAKSRLLFLEKPYLRLKIDADMAISVIYSLIMNVKISDTLPYNHAEVLDFMVDNLIGHIYE